MVDGIAEAAQEHGVTISIMVELVSLGERTGTTPAAALDLARHIEATDNLRFAGLMIYPSDAAIRPRLQETLALLADAGIAAETISGRRQRRQQRRPSVARVDRVARRHFYFLGLELRDSRLHQF